MSLLEKIKDMTDKRELGFLGEEMIHNAWIYHSDINNADEANDAELEKMLNDMKGKKIKINIFSYKSELLNKALDILQPDFKKRNFHFTFHIPEFGWNTSRGAIYYNGSAEVFDSEVRRDIARLSELGFVFEYSGMT